MIKVKIDSVLPGMELGRYLYSSTGKILLAEGMVLDENYIRRLKELGIPAVYIKDSRVIESEPHPEVVSESTKVETQLEVKKIFQQIEQKGKIDLGPSRLMVNKILDEILVNKDVIVSLTDIRTFDEEVFGHSVSVCIFSVMTGLKLNYNLQKLIELGIGGLLHDLGKASIAKTILNKKEQLTPQEFDGIKQHSLIGFEMLRELEEINLHSAHVALQHHEKFNGSGYPWGIKGTEIHEYARITAIADVYDAMTSDRIYRPAFTPVDAVQLLMESIDSHLDHNLVKVFIKNVALYPVGSIVLLNTGEVGVVVNTRPHVVDRPVVRIILDKYHKQFNGICEIDLAASTQYSIISVLNEYNESLPPITHIGKRILSTEM